MKQAVFILLCSFLVQPLETLGHDYYEGLTRITYNQENQKLEIVHRFSTHDLETIVAKVSGNKLSSNSKKFPDLVKQYFQKNFSIWNANVPIKLTMIGAEPGTETTVVYQVVEGIDKVSGLTIYNNLYLEHFPKQINLLNYQDAETQGTMIFSHGDIRSKIR